MYRAWRKTWFGLMLLAAAAVLAGGRRAALGQILGAMSPEVGRFELSDSVQVNRADGTVLADLERVKAHLAARQWDEAVETLRRVLENADGRLVPVTDRRWVGLPDYCHLQLASLPPEALALYRGRVDPVARQWYEQGVAKRDRQLLRKVVEQAFASSWGDDALMALGEMALEQGDTTAARWDWERILPARLPADAPRNWPGYPDTDLDVAAIRARLVLVSILEGSWDRAADELRQFAALHPDARGRLGGTEDNYAKTLGSLLAEARGWPPPKPNLDWPTFAGTTTRNRVATDLVDVGTVVWRAALGEALVPDLLKSQVAREAVYGPAWAYYPVLVGDLVLVGDPVEIRAIDLRTGQPAWGGTSSVVYRDQFDDPVGTALRPEPGLGWPRYTLTEYGGRLYARMGSPAVSPSAVDDTSPSNQPVRPGYLVCLDLAAQGRLVWKIAPDEGWAFEGSPVVDESNVYVGMRRGRPAEAHVACFDAQTGRPKWRVFVCSAETPRPGSLVERAQNLLTLDHQSLYYNTSLGAVAAIATDEGRLRWVSLYPRARQGNLLRPAGHWRRDLSPCVCDRGTLLVAPADSPRVFALDAATGQILWQTGTEVEDVVDLLGTTDEHLIAGGDRLYWIGLKGEDRGRVKHVWPESDQKLGYGRGLLAGDRVLWPTRERIYVFDRKTARQTNVFDLRPHGASGGNLLVARGQLLIATGSELIALGERGGGPGERIEEAARRIPP